LDARRLVFVDESGFNTSMTRLRARAPRGKRAYGKVPVTAARTPPSSLPSPSKEPWRSDNRRRSHGHPSLRSLRRALPGPHARGGTGCGPRDGLGAHRPQRIRELIEARGADLVFFLPSYSPDLNPIEEAFSKIKHLVRKEGARVREALVEAIGRALAAVTAEDAAGWFAHAGYRTQDQPL
jgi:hypothetical protein